MKYDRRYFPLLALALAVTGCSGGNSIAPVAPHTAAPVATGLANQATQIRFSLTIPAAAKTAARRRPQFISPNTAAFSVSENGATVDRFSITDASVCTAATGGAITCTIVIPATAGPNQTFEIQAFSATGAVLSAQTLVTTINAGGANDLAFVLGGVPATLDVSVSPLLTPGTAGSTLVNVNALDASGAMIVGPGVFSDVNGNPVTVTLHSDDSGHTQLAAFSIAQPQSVKLTYDGAALASYVGGITASAPGLASQSIADFACAAPKTPEFLASTQTSNGYEIGRYPLAGGGTAMTSEPPLVNAGPQFSTDASGNIYLFSLSGSAIAVSEFCANASGLVGNAGSPAAADVAAPIAQYAYAVPMPTGYFEPSFAAVTVDPAGNRYTANYQTVEGNTPKYAQIFVTGYGPGNSTIFGPVNATGNASGTDLTGLAAGTQDVYVGTTTSVNVAGTSVMFEASPGFVLPVQTATDAAGDVYALYTATGSLGELGQAGYSPTGNSPAGIVEYSPDGTVKRVISGSSAQIYPTSFAVAPDGTIFVPYGQFYVMSGLSGPSGMAEFGPSQNGNVAPVTTFSAFGTVVGADSSDNAYVLNSNSLTVYNAAGSLQRTISLPAVSSVAVAASGEIAYFSNSSIYTLPAGATSTSQSKKASAATSLNPGTVALVPQSGEIVYYEPENEDGVESAGVFIYNASGTTLERYFYYLTTASDTAYSVSADDAGDVYAIAGDDVEEFAASTQYVSGSSGYSTPTSGFSDYSLSSLLASVGVDGSTGDVLVASCIPGAVGVFAPGLTGSPIRTIAGEKTSLASLPGTCPGTPSMDSNGGIYVPFNGSILEFAPGANGNVAPVGVLRGTSSGAVGFSTSGEKRGVVSLAKRNGAYASALRGKLTCGATRGARAADTCAVRQKALDELERR